MSYKWYEDSTLKLHDEKVMGHNWRAANVSPGFVYCLRSQSDTNRYKIGYTRSLELRIGQYETHFPVGVELLQLWICVAPVTYETAIKNILEPQCCELLEPKRYHFNEKRHTTRTKEWFYLENGVLSVLSAFKRVMEPKTSFCCLSVSQDISVFYKGIEVRRRECKKDELAEINMGYYEADRIHRANVGTVHNSLDLLELDFGSHLFSYGEIKWMESEYSERFEYVDDEGIHWVPRLFGVEIEGNKQRRRYRWIPSYLLSQGAVQPPDIKNSKKQMSFNFDA